MTYAQPKILVALLAIASVCTTALIVMTSFARNGPATDSHLFQQGLALPEFLLTERNGQPFGSEQLRGKVWIVNFIFTRCPGICPALMQQMAGLQTELAKHPQWPHIRLVSISVDPGHDTPPRLQQYAQHYQADREHWLFLTGDRDEIWTLCEQGFKQTVAENKQNSTIPILHTSNFLLVDRHLHIRGAYNGLDAEQRATLKQDLQRVLDCSASARALKGTDG